MDFDQLSDSENGVDETANAVYLFSPFYSRQQKDCMLCLYKFLPKYSTQISKFETMLEEVNSKLGCGTKTCVNLVLNEIQNDDTMNLFHEISPPDICQHFDSIFGSPMCGYNRSKSYDFFSLFNENTVDSDQYISFVYDTYKNSRTTSLCPYSLLAVYIYIIMVGTFGEVSEYKKKHDFLWLFNALSNHKIRLGKLQ